MKISKEHILAFKISILLLFFAFLITLLFQNLNNYGILDLKKGVGNNKYIIFIILSIIIYFISFFLARITIQPIEDNNKKLKEYNHNLAHELRTPLTIIKSNLELLSLNYNKDLIDSSNEEIKSMVEIIDSLLFLSENNELKEKEKININLLLEKYLFKNILVIKESDFIIDGNRYLLDRLLKNLIENSKKFSPKNQKIEIRINKDSFFISNKFIGNIPKKDIKYLFDTFYKVDNSRNSKGYGLGLSIVKKICDLHKLEINIKIFNNNFIVIIREKKHYL